MFKQIKNMPLSTRIVLGVMICWAVYVGGTKPPGPGPGSARVAQLVFALSGGGIVDPSSVIGTATQLAAIEMFNAETASIVAAASNIVADALADYAALTNQLTSGNYSVAYVGYDFPRADPPASTNHNITATIQHVSSSGTTNGLSVWIYFSAAPATNVNVYLQASVADGEWIELPPGTNTWPATEVINTLPCVRYDYTVPPGMRGVPLKPFVDLKFGGYSPGQYLSVSDVGVIVVTNGVDCAPYTGWDASHPDPFSNLAIRYIGGVAVEAVASGTNYAGVVTQEIHL